MAERLDIVIVGAGISGIGAAWHVRRRLRGKSWALLESRERIGGTWDLFRYPGIRSDSDMFTLGFPFRPWTGEQTIAAGADIRAYLEETAREAGIDRNIRFGHRVVRADWSSADACWRLEIEAGGERRAIETAFLFLGSGYYDYAEGYRPDWPGEADYRGRIVHPQTWPEDLDFGGRKIVVIGSGATAVTLVPALAETAAHVTMVQRSPSYIVPRPATDPLTRWLRRLLPARAAARMIRRKNVLLGALFFKRSRTKPAKVRALLLGMVRDALKPGYDIERDFSPSYNPWDQRVCLAPDGDLFSAMNAGKVSVVTDRIERFTETGLRMATGKDIEADIVVTATGLVVKLLGGIALSVDGDPVNLADRFSYKGMMLNGVPNLVLSFGYTNASWTLKSDLTARWFCRLVRHLDAKGHEIAAPRLDDPAMARAPMLDFSSGYVARARDAMPAQGPEAPWKVHQNYFRDVAALRLRPIADGVLAFGRRLTPDHGRATQPELQGEDAR